MATPSLIWHPFTQMQTAPPPLLIERAEGSYLYDDKGNRYIDAISSWWVNLHGHSHPYIARKIAEQARLLEHVMFAGFTHKPALELAEKLLPLLPGNFAKIFYSDNGSTAVETALKMALQYWHNQNIRKTKVICFKKSYHGDTFGAMSVAGKNNFNRPFWSYLFDVITIDPPLKGQEHKSLLQLKNHVQQGDVACFIFEPLLLAAGGMIIYPASGLDALLECCRKRKVLTIADEVMTGFGRTGTLFACDQLTQKPDLICLSKGITGGFLPLGATACTQQIYDRFLGEDATTALLHGHSYTANPLCCASALASLELLLEEHCSTQRQMIAACHKEFCESFDHPALERLESLGTVLALELKAASKNLYSFFLSKGIVMRPLHNVFYLIPPYCITQEDLHYIYKTIKEGLDERFTHADCAIRYATC